MVVLFGMVATVYQLTLIDKLSSTKLTLLLTLHLATNSHLQGLSS